MSEADSGPTPEPRQIDTSPIQLVDVFVVDCTAQREDHEGTAAPDPRFDVQTQRTDLSDDRLTFGARLRIRGTAPLPQNIAVTWELVVQGIFTSETPIEDDFFEAFTQQTPLVLLWPFARVYTSQLGVMLGAPIPLLPSLQVPIPGDESGDKS